MVISCSHIIWTIYLLGSVIKIIICCLKSEGHIYGYTTSSVNSNFVADTFPNQLSSATFVARLHFCLGLAGHICSSLYCFVTWFMYFVICPSNVAINRLNYAPQQQPVVDVPCLLFFCRIFNLNCIVRLVWSSFIVFKLSVFYNCLNLFVKVWSPCPWKLRIRCPTLQQLLDLIKPLLFSVFDYILHDNCYWAVMLYCIIVVLFKLYLLRNSDNLNYP